MQAERKSVIEWIWAVQGSEGWHTPCWRIRLLCRLVWESMKHFKWNTEVTGKISLSCKQERKDWDEGRIESGKLVPVAGIPGEIVWERAVWKIMATFCLFVCFWQKLEGMAITRAGQLLFGNAIPWFKLMSLIKYFVNDYSIINNKKYIIFTSHSLKLCIKFDLLLKKIWYFNYIAKLHEFMQVECNICDTASY